MYGPRWVCVSLLKSFIQTGLCSLLKLSMHKYCFCNGPLARTGCANVKSSRDFCLESYETADQRLQSAICE